MIEPLKAGDKCRVINALGRSKSPNLGLIVTVQSRQYGTHGADSVYGPIWRCVGDGICQYNDMGGYEVMGFADFAEPWLEKIPPLKTPDKVQETETQS